MRRSLFFCLVGLLSFWVYCMAQEAEKSTVPYAVHPKIGTVMNRGGLSIKLTDRRQNYNWLEKGTVELDIFSPKSVNFHPGGGKFYVNSLEGGTTIVFDSHTKEKIKLIRHKFAKGSESLWAKASGLYTFRYKRPDSLYFYGKPVESAFSHNGRYLWVPYYRRSFDLNSQEPSAMAVIDTQRDTIIKMFETGPLPKMVAVSPDGKYLAVTHWGNNTVGVLNISSQNPKNWHYIACYVVDYQLKLNLPYYEKVSRDMNSGYCLRGTVFTPDNHYLLVGCMGGGGGIAVIDLLKGQYLGRMMGTLPNLRHLVIDHGYLYASINAAGYVQRIPLDKFLACASTLSGGTLNLKEWQNCKVPSGARTIVLSPDGRYVFVACNFSSCIAVVDSSTMSLVGTISADSFPVGLDISEDGKTLISTSQGRSGSGGNAVDIYEIIYPS